MSAGAAAGLLCGECDRLREQVRRLTLVAQDQARALAELTDECPPDAPSLAYVYWKWSDARRAEKGWQQIWNCIRWLISDLGALPAPLMTPLAWDGFRARCKLRVTPRGAPPCDATLNLYLVYAKSMLNFAVERGMIKRNPLALAKPVPTQSQRETHVGRDDVDRLLDAADDVVNRRLREGDDDGTRAKLLKAFILCKFDGLMRFTEARKLRISQIDRDGRIELLASETKGKRKRSIRLTPRALEAIRAIERPPGAIYVFEGQPAYPGSKRGWGLISDGRMRAWFYRACKVSGVDAIAAERDGHVTPHDLRAGGATAADEGGARARAIQRVLGHRSLRTTQRYLRSEDEKDADDVWGVMSGELRRPPQRAGRISKK